MLLYEQFVLIIFICAHQRVSWETSGFYKFFITTVFSNMVMIFYLNIRF
ncbi:uncharacterized protein METZ01_LOCUS197648 [marine metagenome]|uniref:Uncharacterized protein n=1 Tax=marine metagenome TaxID=408172 RepID=A0A382E3T9_9ZZZZ